MSQPLIIDHGVVKEAIAVVRSSIDQIHSTTIEYTALPPDEAGALYGIYDAYRSWLMPGQPQLAEKSLEGLADKLSGALENVAAADLLGRNQIEQQNAFTAG